MLSNHYYNQHHHMLGGMMGQAAVAASSPVPGAAHGPGAAATAAASPSPYASAGPISPQLVDELRTTLLRSQIVTPADGTGYQDAIARWNAAAQRPAGLVVFASCTEDVVAALRFARRNGFDVAVRGGGHFSGPASSSEGGVVIDLRRLNRLSIDTDKKVLRAGGGSVWADIDQYTTHHGLAAVVGTASRTGVGGAALGGGYGWLTGSHGLALDNIVAARVVLADGTVADASETENPELFWALRGAGPNFGIVVEVSLKLHRQDWCVFAGSLGFPLEKADEVLDALNAILPDPSGKASAVLSLSNIAPASPTTPVILVSVFFNGREKPGRRFFESLYALNPAFDTTAPVPFVKLNTLGDDPRAKMGRRQTMSGTCFRAPLDKTLFRAVAEDYATFVRGYGAHSEGAYGGGVAAEVIFEFHSMDKVTSVPHDATSFANRGDFHNVYAGVSWADPALDATVENWAASVRDQLRWKYQTSSDGAAVERGTGWYGNYNDGKIPSSVIFGDHYQKLRELKGKYDPQNVFNKWYPIEPKIDVRF